MNWDDVKDLLEAVAALTVRVVALEKAAVAIPAPVAPKE